MLALINSLKTLRWIICLIAILILNACAAHRPYVKNQEQLAKPGTSLDPSNIDYEIYLVGDISNASDDVTTSDVVDMIKSQLVDDGIKRSVVFLGNSFSKDGLSDLSSSEFAALDEATDRCIKKLKDHTEKVYFIPGNTEWSDGNEHTVSAVQDVEDYIQSKANEKNIFAPSNGCGEPKDIDLTDDLMLILIDSQWVLQGDRSSERKRSSCGVDNESELITFIQEKLSKNKDKHVIIAAHHPIFSNGKTGGNYGMINHLLPLPILGSVITGIRKLNGGPQRFGHPQYESYRAMMLTALSNHEDVIHVSAHDKNLQYHYQNDNHYVIAGSGSEVDFTRKKGTADFAYMKKGFTKITHTKDRELWLEFYVQDGSDPTQLTSVYKKRLSKKEKIDYSNKSVYKDLDEYPQSVKTIASKKYAKGIIGMGKTHRAEWGTEVTVPILLLDEIAGGVKPVQQGGGFQTKSLRLENADGRQWVIRTINKDLEKLIPPALRNTIAADIAQDGISASHPYGAFVIPKLAEAAKIYHANPKLVWVPKQKALGDYNLTLADRLYLFEERPGGNMKGHPNYGGAKESVNTPELVEKLLKNHKHSVDQEYVLRCRLFDILIGDWDRHGDQWRWGIYEDPDDPDKKLYRSIPRDRDQVFFINDGPVNWIASRPYFNPQLRKYDYEVDFLDGLGFNARHFDRHFLAQMDEEDFIHAAEEIVNNVTDEVIESAFADWPKEIYDIRGDVIIAKLKSRRKDLVKYAKEHYKYLTREVTVIGTNSQNTFDVTSLEDNRLDVKAYHLDDDEKHMIFSRIIDGRECEELRLYGLKKKDTFNFYGHYDSSVKVRLVGGSGEDRVNNESSNIKILAYDRPDGMTHGGNNIKAKLKDHKGINRFDRLDWKFDRTIHFPGIGFYTDTGLGLTYNLWSTKNGFRKNPYKSHTTLVAGYYWGNSAVVANYSGHFPAVFSPDWDFRFEAAFTGPTFTQQFYGLGNAYINYEEILTAEPEASDRDFYNVRGTHLDLNPNFERNLGNNRTFSINPSLEYLNLSDDPDDPEEPKFIFFPEAGRTSSDFNSKIYTGLGIKYKSNRINLPAIPTRGYIFDVGADYKQSLSDTEFSNLTFTVNLAAYIPFSPTHKIVLATNIGGSYTLGDYEFFHANYLSNLSRMRGYRINRFAGDGIIYHATDLRINLFQGRGALKSGLGIYGSFDYGRAFLEIENNNNWHSSYGGGLYLTPLNLLGFKIGYHRGQKDTQFLIGGVLSY